MAWHYTEFYAAVRARLTGDVTLNGLVDGIYSAAAPDSATTYVVTSVVAADGDDEAFRTYVRTYQFRLQIIVPAESTSATDPLDLQGQIAQRIEGNWYEKAFGVEPDYGLARWTPSLASWECKPLELIQIETLDAGTNRLALGMAFETRITKEAA